MFDECRTEGDFILSSGRKSGVFYDFDLLMPSATAHYVQRLIKLLPDHIRERVDFIASPALGGIIPGYLVAFALGVPLVIVDKAGKSRGPIRESGSYLIVDDVITSFQAANRVRDALAGLEPLGVAAYIFRGTDEDLNKQDYPAFYLSRKEQEV